MNEHEIEQSPVYAGSGESAVAGLSEIEPMLQPDSGNAQKIRPPTEATPYRFVLRSQPPRTSMTEMGLAIRHTKQKFGVQLRLAGSDPEFGCPVRTPPKEIRLLIDSDQGSEAALKHFAWLVGLNELQLSRASVSDTDFKPIGPALIGYQFRHNSFLPTRPTPKRPPAALTGPLRYSMRGEFANRDLFLAQTLVENAVGGTVEFKPVGDEYSRMTAPPNVSLMLAAEEGSEAAVNLFAELVAQGPFELVRVADFPMEQPASISESKVAEGPEASPCHETASTPAPHSTTPLLALPSLLRPTAVTAPVRAIPPPPMPGAAVANQPKSHDIAISNVVTRAASAPGPRDSGIAQVPAGTAVGPIPQPQGRRRTIFDIACDYHSRGISVVPQLAGAKQPCVKWKPFQKARPTLLQLEEWFGKAPADTGIAAILGPVSNLFVIDVDGKEAHDELVARLGNEPMVPKVLSGSGDPFRYHLFFQHPQGIATRAKITPWHPKLEFRGDRGILVLPPSLHKSGKSYRWAQGRSLEDVSLTEVPAAVGAALQERAAQDAAIIGAPAEAPDHVPNDNLLSLTRVQRRAAAYLGKVPAAVAGQGGDRQTYAAACALVVRFGLSPEQALPLLQQWNRQCRPPWSESELQRKLQEAAKEPGPRGELLKQGSTAAVPATDELNALEGVAPTWASMYDTGLIDPSRAELFEVIADSPRLFAGIHQWLTAEDLRQAQAASAHVQPWAARVRAIAAGVGGMILTDGPTHWALRLQPALSTGPDCYHVLAIGVPRAATVTSKAANAPLPSNPAEHEEAIRSQLSQNARKLHLFRKAGQVLWLVHAELLRQRSTHVVLPDIGIAEVLWGAQANRWPRNWRRDVHTILRSLQGLRMTTISDPAVLLQGVPEEIRKQVVFRYVQDGRAKTGKGKPQDPCPSGCALHGTHRRHHHIAVGVGQAFIGLLRKFAVADTQGNVVFDFSPNLGTKLAQARQDNEACSFERKSDQKRALQKDLNQVRQSHLDLFRGLAKVPLVVPLFGPLAGVSTPCCQLLRVLVRETCRAKKGLQAKRADGAHAFWGKRVPGNKRHQQLSCPFLNAAREYIAFNGNRVRWGQGYRLTTWASRAGYHPSAPVCDRSELEAIRAFLACLDQLAKEFDLIVGGLRGSHWYSLAELHEMAKAVHHLRELRLMSLRIYAAADCYAAWRCRLASTMPAGPASVVHTSAVERVLGLKKGLKQAGISQQALADHLGKSRSYITKLLAGSKPLSESLGKRVRAFIDQRMQEAKPGPSLG